MDYMDYFRQISEIPRGSYYNDKIGDYLVNFAKEKGLFYLKDKAGNVLIRKEAAKGYENLPGIIIQGHMDMVCVKDEDSDHDFKTQGLKLVEDEESIWAEGTSLGGDDGIAIAYGLAILGSKEYEHPLLELLVTTDEEVGMHGAIAFDAGQLKGKWLLNVDSEEEDTIITGCAGGVTARVEVPVERWDKDIENDKMYKIEVSGLLGGHSGTEIGKNRKNASLILAGILAEIRNNVSLNLYDIKGGEKDNVITSEAYSVVSFSDTDRALEFTGKIISEAVDELRSFEPGVKISINPVKDFDKNIKPVIGETIENILNYILLAPNAVQTMSPDIEGMVESSLNLGILKIEEKTCIFEHSIRSMSKAYKKFMCLKIKKLARTYGGIYKEHGAYPEWKYRERSEFRDRAAAVYKEVFKREPKQLLIHAGLECGILSEKKPELEIISVGPDISDIHSTREKMSKASAKRVFDFILEVLKCGKMNKIIV